MIDKVRAAEAHESKRQGKCSENLSEVQQPKLAYQVKLNLRIPANVNTVPIEGEQSERSEGSAFRMSVPLTPP